MRKKSTYHDALQGACAVSVPGLANYERVLQGITVGRFVAYVRVEGHSKGPDQTKVERISTPHNSKKIYFYEASEVLHAALMTGF